MNGSLDSPSSDADTRIVEAAAWRVHLTETSSTSTPEFEAWRLQPGSEEAWAKVGDIWDFVGEQANALALIKVRQMALGRIKRIRNQRERKGKWNRFLTGAVAASIVGVVVSGMVWQLTRPSDYATAVGERRVISLADGSRLSLDSQSEVTVRYSRAVRELRLVRGQARFDVSHDYERPFFVRAGHEKVVATGTSFNVELAASGVQVSMIEGHVMVFDDKSGRLLSNAVAPPKARLALALSTGQALLMPNNGAPKMYTANLQRVMAWTNGQLWFDDDPLSYVVDKMNRYRTTPIVIDDPKVASMRISGVFNTTKGNEFVDILTRYLPIRSDVGDGGSIKLEAK